MTDTTTGPSDTDEPVHEFFSLSYSNYFVTHRTLAQSMPLGWQRRWVACMEELDAAFEHIETAPMYQVQAAREVEYGDLSEAEMLLLDVSLPDAAEYEGDEPPDVYYDRDGNEHQPHERALIPVGDPVPHYNRGRTHIAPKLPVVTDAEPEHIRSTEHADGLKWAACNCGWKSDIGRGTYEEVAFDWENAHIEDVTL
jgi:hypothetical protein